MKNSFQILLITCLILSGLLSVAQTRSNYVSAYPVTQGGESYRIIELSRKDKRVNAKYFAYEKNGKSIAQRYTEFKKSHNVILFTSGTYMTDHNSANAKPVGLTIDDGAVVNNKLSGMDGLVIVYATGGIVVSNIEDKDLTLGGLPGKIDLNNGQHMPRFRDWAEDKKATVFQTHLLAYKNELKFKLNKENYRKTSAGKQLRERRFLAICKTKSGEVKHLIIHKGDKSKGENLYDASEKVLNFLKYRKQFEVIALLNLDPGSQDVFQYYNNDGKENPIIKGEVGIDNARNLLVYYFE